LYTPKTFSREIKNIIWRFDFVLKYLFPLAGFKYDKFFVG
jgi:hypothetical protein